MRSHRFDVIAAPQDMDHLVRRECARSDRNGQVFSLVMFRVGGNNRRRTKTAYRLARTMLKRARLTDDIGWLGTEYLAALLPDTAPQGARAFADGVSSIIAAHHLRPLAMVFTYPRDAAALAAMVQPMPTSMTVNGGENFDRGLKFAGSVHHQSVSSIQAVGAGHSSIIPLEGRTFSNRDNRSFRDDSGPLKINAGGFVKPKIPASSLRISSEEMLPVAGVEELLAFPMPLWKRVLDVVFAIAIAVLLSPVLLAAAIAVKCSSPGEVIFKQRRSGLGGKPFLIYKFRTMVVDAEARQEELRKFNEQDGPAFKLTADPRVTRIGAILRKTSIDELPQLLNVLKGEMSLVGPRPLPIKEQEGCEQWQRHRLNVTPGLTCIWQVKGRSTVSFAEWVRMDVEYIRRRTLFNDLYILFSTLPSVLLRRGAR